MMQLISSTATCSPQPAGRGEASEQAHGYAAHLADSRTAAYEDGLRAARQAQGIPADAGERLHADLRGILEKVLEHARTVCDPTPTPPQETRECRHCHTCTRHRRIDRLLELTSLLKRAQGTAAALPPHPETNTEVLLGTQAKFQPPTRTGGSCLPTASPEGGPSPASTQELPSA